LAAADDSLCYSIIGNLTKNAIEAAPERSTVTLTLIAGMDLNDGDFVQLDIHNIGTVPQELRANFFAKYSTSGKSGGTGLGTYSSHLLATVQGGSLQMQSSEQAGTTLSLRLKPGSLVPAQVGLQSQEEVPQTAQEVLQLLLVDDDDFNQMVMSEYIPESHFKLDTAINGRMALDKVAQQRPDIIIMDLDMPIMGGAEALTQIRRYQENQQNHPSFIIAYSGNDDEQSRNSYLQLGFDACLNKPCSRDEVLGMLQQVANGMSSH
jgi:CheY-like chemotaxis protein